MYQVNPNQNIFVAYLITDTSDANTYFVQSVMRDTATGTTLGTVKLTRDANNSRRFTGSIQAPSQNAAQGRFVDIITTVYTDSGYSVKSQTYGEDMRQFLVKTLWDISLNGGGGGGGVVGNSTAGMRDIVREELAKVLAAIEKQGKTGSPEPIDVQGLSASVTQMVMQAVIPEIGKAMAIVNRRKIVDHNKILADMRASVESMVNEIVAKPLSEFRSKVGQMRLPSPMVVPEHIVRSMPKPRSSLERSAEPRRPSDGIKPAYLTHRMKPKPKTRRFIVEVPEAA